MSENKRPVLPQHVREVLDSDASNAVLASLDVAGGGSDADFDTITRMASQIMQAPVALVTLVGREQQHFRSKSEPIWTVRGGNFVLRPHDR